MKLPVKLRDGELSFLMSAAGQGERNAVVISISPGGHPMLKDCPQNEQHVERLRAHRSQPPTE